ncbi:MAG TPA: DUF881 domain-containing protein [Marmoricola sp.]|nr:DUF881 domain-containing protein [Marmoricola sp.]
MPDRTSDPSTRTESTEPTGRQRLRAAMHARWSRGQAVVGVLLAVLGFAAVVQVRANDADEVFVGAREGDLIALINTLALATDRAEAEIADLRRTRDSLQDDAESTATAIAVARERADTLGILAGTLPAEGPGIRITVEAQAGELGSEQLLNGLQELRNAGAEAIEINDEVRVVAQSGLTEGPDGRLAVDGVLLDPPYVIDVIGDPHTLATALEFDGGFIEEVEAVAGSVSVEQLDTVDVTSTRRPVPPRFANPVEEE